MARVLRSGIVAAVIAAVAVLASGCKGGGASVQQVVAGAPAGDVTEISGDVHATRDGKIRAIAKGDVVSGDDVIATGGDGRITVVLRHNHVPWSLGPNKEKKVADSAAWSAAEGASGEQVTDDHSTAAGRHAERSATDTGVSATASAAAAPEAPTPGAPAAAMPEPRRVAPPEAVPVAPPEPPPPTVQPAATPPPPPRAVQPSAPAQKSDWPSDDAIDSGGVAGGAPGAGSDGGSLGTIGRGGGGPGGAGSTGGAVGHSGPTPRITIGEVASSGGLATDLASRTLAVRTGTLRACYQRGLQRDPTLAGLLEVALDVGADGRVTGVRVDGPGELSDVEACMRHAMTLWVFASAGAASHVTAKIVLAPVSP